MRPNFLLGTPSAKLLVLHIHHLVGDFGNRWSKMSDYVGGNKPFLLKLVLTKSPYGQWWLGDHFQLLWYAIMGLNHKSMMS